MNEKTKKWLTLAGLTILCIGLILGISKVLYKEPKQPATAIESAEDTELETEVEADTEDVTEPEVMQETGTEESSGEELVIKPEAESGITENQQEIQKDPVKTEEEKPAEPPALSEEADVKNPDAPPVYEEPKVEEAEQSEQPGEGTPSHGDTKDGMIYINGFGWIPNEGGGGSGTIADDMYENGNKIGIMD